MVGPVIGAALYETNENAPIATVLGLYSVVFILVLTLYRRNVIGAEKDKVQ